MAVRKNRLSLTDDGNVRIRIIPKEGIWAILNYKCFDLAISFLGLYPTDELQPQ